MAIMPVSGQWNWPIMSYNWDRSPEVDDVEDLAAAATKHLELLKQKEEAESIFL